VLDCALIDVATIEPLVPLGDLIDRLGDLEARIAGKGGSRPTPSPSGPGGSGGGSGSRPPPKTTVPASPAGKGRGPSVRADDGQSSASAGSGSGGAPHAAGSSYRAQSAPVTAPSHTVAVSDSAPSSKSAPVSMQPSGPVPRVDAVATGSGPQPIALPQSPAEALDAWAKVIEDLEEQRIISLRGFYEFARVLKWTATVLDLGFAPDDDSRWAGENAIETRNVEELRGLLADLGHKVKVTVRMLDAAESKNLASRSIVESTRETKYAERTRREKEAREHPITKHVLHTFGAAIKEIKTDV
jgi:DNA polymerase-3 subunit gamma/tau